MSLPTLTKIRSFLYSSRPITWAGHALQGYLVMAAFVEMNLGRNAGFAALTYHAVAREFEGIYDAASAGNTHKLVDGVADFIAFWAGAALYAFTANF